MSLLARTLFLPLRASTALTTPSARPVPLARRFLHETHVSKDYAAKYADKLEKRAQEEGASVEELRKRVLEQERQRSKQRLAAASEAAAQSSANVSGPSASASIPKSQLPPGASIRKDSSPIKPLSSILNLTRLLETPHTSAQISALWTAYHASRSGGTGRGFICASLSRETYDTMMAVAQKYPAFVVPVPRIAGPEASDAQDIQKGYEFYFMQWLFHDAPLVPVPGQTEGFPFNIGASTPASPPLSEKPNSRTATILFTPLLEYKLRQTFATPYLVLTFYPDLSSSHDVVLLRGEITPTVAKSADASSGAKQGEFLLSQQDAQLLAIAVQKFYLWSEGEGAKEREVLLKHFHEKPEDFQWEGLLKHGEVGA